MNLRVAMLKDLTSIKYIADKNKRHIGFVMTPAITESITKNWILVAEIKGKIVGFLRFRHRRDCVVKIYEICVTEEHRNKSIGKNLIIELRRIAKMNNCTRIELKCPEGAPANKFYNNLSFINNGISTGRIRRLINWSITI